MIITTITIRLNKIFYFNQWEEKSNRKTTNWKINRRKKRKTWKDKEQERSAAMQAGRNKKQTDRQNRQTYRQCPDNAKRIWQCYRFSGWSNVSQKMQLQVREQNYAHHQPLPKTVPYAGAEVGAHLRMRYLWEEIHECWEWLNEPSQRGENQ